MEAADAATLTPMPSEPLPFVDTYLAALLAQASDLISSEFHEVVRENGFTVAEWRVLATLSDGQALPTGRLAEIAMSKQPTVTRLLDRMAAKGDVERLPHEGDRRITLVRITPQGRRHVSRLIERAREHEKRVLEPFGLTRAEELKATLRRIIELHRPATKE